MASAQQKLEYYVSQIDKEVSVDSKSTFGLENETSPITLSSSPQLSKYPALNRLEQQTSVPKAYGVIGVASVFVTCVVFNIASGFLSYLLGRALPAYFSIKAHESPGHQDDIQWLTYWVIFGAFTFVESFSKVIVAWSVSYFF